VPCIAEVSQQQVCLPYTQGLNGDDWRVPDDGDDEARSRKLLTSRYCKFRANNGNSIEIFRVFSGQEVSIAKPSAETDVSQPDGNSSDALKSVVSLPYSAVKALPSTSTPRCPDRRR
jgi:hypothetical protein